MQHILTKYIMGTWSYNQYEHILRKHNINDSTYSIHTCYNKDKRGREGFRTKTIT